MGVLEIVFNNSMKTENISLKYLNETVINITLEKFNHDNGDYEIADSGFNFTWKTIYFDAYTLKIALKFSDPLLISQTRLRD